jgi:N-acetylglucosaminyldiphosphoundecaprenol N-acetyl-beta-D-mannosaminyltransferase
MIRVNRCALVFNVNVDICMQARRDLELASILRSADLILVDGTPMMWAANLLGTPLPDRVSGSDFLTEFCKSAATKGHRLFLLGAAPGVAYKAKLTLEQANPGLQIVGTYSPPYGFECDSQENRRIINEVRRTSPDVLFVAFGAPKEQKWLNRVRSELNVPVSMGIGSSLDYLAGKLRRAPRWIQVIGLEWIFRLMQEPRRLWRRYLLNDVPFVYHLICQLVRVRLSRRT